MSDTLSLLVAVCAWHLYYCAEISFQVQRVSLWFVYADILIVLFVKGLQLNLKIKIPQD